MKNEAANFVLSKILHRPVWRNLHELPVSFLYHKFVPDNDSTWQHGSMEF